MVISHQMMAQIQEIKNNRIPQLMDILEEVEGKAVIWAHYRYDIDKIVDSYIKKIWETIL